MKDIRIPVSLGELIDKITILQIKKSFLNGDPLKNVTKELNALEAEFGKVPFTIDNSLISRLKDINKSLWNIEDSIRNHEHNGEFGEDFVRLARSVYKQNDKRASIKKEINILYGSAFIEEKSYADYEED